MKPKYPKLLRVTTVPESLATLLKGQHNFMRNHGFEVIGVSSPGHFLDEVAEKEKIRTVPLLMTRAITPLQDLKSLWQFYRLCKKEKPCIVHTHTPKAGIIGMLGAKLAGVPIRLHTVAGLPLMEAKGFKKKLLCFIEKMTYALATVVYPNSQGLQDYIIKNSFTKKEKLKIIFNSSSNGIDTHHFSPESVSLRKKESLRKELGLNENDFVFLFIGRLVGDKGLNELIEAFSKLKSTIKKRATNVESVSASKSGFQNFSFAMGSEALELIDHHDRNIKLLLVGNYEPELDPLKPETLQKINLHPDIEYVGYQKDVRPYLAISNCFVFPSYREGFPNVVMQAASMQLNCIVSDINGCNEIISDGENGWLVPSKNPDALLEKMIWCYENPENCHKMGEGNHDIIHKKFEQRFYWEALHEEYLRVLKKYNKNNKACYPEHLKINYAS